MLQIVDYNAGNPTSVQRALAAVGVPSQITASPEVVANAERVIFPGVGHAASTMAVLRARGLDQALREVRSRGTPLLGVCVGAQLMLDRSEEGDTPCLGLIAGTVRRFPALDRTLKVPHMGWNRVTLRRSHELLAALPHENELYFVHSYYLSPESAANVVADCDYGLQFACAMATENLFAVQFHPEKSGPLGLELLRRFSRWDPERASC
jgi:imidazole glycerol-phosphate synthase subunit HisH